MNKISTYLASLIVSVFLVLSLIASSAALLVDMNVTRDKAMKLAESGNISGKVYDELDKYYTDRGKSSGIPASVFMEAINQDFINDGVRNCISAAFNTLANGSGLDISISKNEKLENNIREFFNNYADKEGYNKDEKFNKKVGDTISQTYKNIKSHCDVYKAGALQEHKVLGKVSMIYRKRVPVTIALIAADIIFIALLLIINRKKKVTVLYWMGISSIIAGISGAVPSLILLVTKFYDSFSIKQPSVFTAYTSAMYKMTEAFMAVCIACVVIGIVLTVVYTITYDKSKHQDVKPTDL